MIGASTSRPVCGVEHNLVLLVVVAILILVDEGDNHAVSS